MSDQDRTFPNNIITILGRQVMGIKEYWLGVYQLVQYHILQTNIMEIIQQTVKRIKKEILALKKLHNVKTVSHVIN